MPAHPHGLLEFDVVDDPWIDVLWIDGTVSTVSLRQVFQAADRIACISESSPLMEVAMLRFLIAFFSDGLREQLRSEDSWRLLVERCRAGLPDAELQAVLAPLQGRANVLDPDHSAFFDGPGVRGVSGWDEPRAWQAATQLLPEVPTGTNIAHFVHSFHGEPALCVACLLKCRALDAAFARGGLGPSLSRNLLATISGSEPRYVILSGETLLQTLLLNAITGDASRASWVAIHSPTAGEPGPIARMSWRPRLLMPIASSQTHIACARCGRETSPRFTQVVLVDTYNHAGSPFGSKSDIERWKTDSCDPQLLPFEKGALSLGVNPREWPLRALSRVLSSSSEIPLARLAEGAPGTGDRILISVTSSAGNQMKIDDAPHAALRVPTAVFVRSPGERAAIAAALGKIFEPGNRARRETLIPDAVPRLLDELAVTDNPEQAVEQWLQTGRRSRRMEEPPTRLSPPPDQGTTVELTEELTKSEVEEELSDWKVAERIVRCLSRLSAAERAALRPQRLQSADAIARRQAAFEKVWYSLRLPSNVKRHPLRSALATIAAVYALHADRCRLISTPYAFERQLLQRLIAEQAPSPRPGSVSPVRRRLWDVIRASPSSRDEYLLRLIEAVVSDSSSRGPESIDLADLFVAVTRWNAPMDPTPARWRRLLESAPAFTTTSKV